MQVSWKKKLRLFSQVDSAGGDWGGDKPLKVFNPLQLYQENKMIHQF